MLQILEEKKNKWLLKPKHTVSCLDCMEVFIVFELILCSGKILGTEIYW